MNLQPSALIIESAWLVPILKREKFWVLHTRRCQKRGIVGLIQSGLDYILGVAKVTGCYVVNAKKMHNSQSKHGLSVSEQTEMLERYPKVYAWVLKDATPLLDPIRYQPRRRAIFVHLDADTCREIARQLIADDAFE